MAERGRRPLAPLVREGERLVERLHDRHVRHQVGRRRGGSDGGVLVHRYGLPGMVTTPVLAARRSSSYFVVAIDVPGACTMTGLTFWGSCRTSRSFAIDSSSMCAVTFASPPLNRFTRD